LALLFWCNAKISVFIGYNIGTVMFKLSDNEGGCHASNYQAQFSNVCLSEQGRRFSSFNDLNAQFSYTLPQQPSKFSLAHCQQFPVTGTVVTNPPGHRFLRQNGLKSLREEIFCLRTYCLQLAGHLLISRCTHVHPLLTSVFALHSAHRDNQ